MAGSGGSGEAEWIENEKGNPEERIQYNTTQQLLGVCVKNRSRFRLMILIMIMINIMIIIMNTIMFFSVFLS